MKRRRRYVPLYVLMAITILPIAAAYIAYYFVPPSGRTNYGELLPQRPIPELPLTNLDGSRFDLRQLGGSWVFVMVDGALCDKPCEDKLLMMRQQRTMTGKDRDRIERVWLVTDQEPLPIMLMREYEGTHFVRAPMQPLRDLLVLPAAAGAQLKDHIWLIDPRGNLMLRWPKTPDVNGVKRDIAKLLKVSAGWIRIDPRRAQPEGQ